MIDPPHYPLGTISTYGPDEQTVTKIVATLVPGPGLKATCMTWVGADLIDNLQVQEEIRQFFSSHRVQSIVASDGNLGCPHEEGEDFLVGEDCPFCPYWMGKTTRAQGQGERSVAP